MAGPIQPWLAESEFLWAARAGADAGVEYFVDGEGRNYMHIAPGAQTALLVANVQAEALGSGGGGGGGRGPSERMAARLRAHEAHVRDTQPDGNTRRVLLVLARRRARGAPPRELPATLPAPGDAIDLYYARPLRTRPWKRGVLFAGNARVVAVHGQPMERASGGTSGVLVWQ